MAGKERSIVVVGSLNYDIILRQQRLPQRGETYLVNGATVSGGGKGANQACQVAKMGVESVMCGAVGRDLFGERICKDLDAYGVETKYVKRTDETTGLGINNVLTDGSLYANVALGANLTLAREDIDALEPVIAASSALIVQLEIPVEVAEYAIAVARRHQCYTILNAAPAKRVSEQILAQVDCLTVNESEASYYVGRPIATLQDALNHCEQLYRSIRGILVVTLGENGSLLYNENQALHIPARAVEAVDTTGAGDSYVGVFASKVVSGLSYLDAAVYASLAASITVTKLGAQPAMPVAEELEALYREAATQPIRVGKKHANG